MKMKWKLIESLHRDLPSCYIWWKDPLWKSQMTFDKPGCYILVPLWCLCRVVMSCCSMTAAEAVCKVEGKGSQNLREQSYDIYCCLRKILQSRTSENQQFWYILRLGGGPIVLTVGSIPYFPTPGHQEVMNSLSRGFRGTNFWFKSMLVLGFEPRSINPLACSPLLYQVSHWGRLM